MSDRLGQSRPQVALDPAKYRFGIGNLRRSAGARSEQRSWSGAVANQLRGRPDDIVINLVEVAKENWSFGHGIAQYAS